MRIVFGNYNLTTCLSLRNDWVKVNVLLTGATGFLGSHLLKRLVSIKDIRLTVLKRSFSKLERIKDLLNSENISGCETTLNFGALPYRDDEIMNSKADTTDLKNIGWQPKYSLDEGLLKVISGLKNDR